jgi:hypothetical protein
MQRKWDSLRRNSRVARSVGAILRPIVTSRTGRVLSLDRAERGQCFWAQLGGNGSHVRKVRAIGAGNLGPKISLPTKQSLSEPNSACLSV